MGALATAPGTQGEGGDGWKWVGALRAGCELSPRLLGQMWAVLSSQLWSAGGVGSTSRSRPPGSWASSGAPKPALPGLSAWTVQVPSPRRLKLGNSGSVNQRLGTPVWGSLRQLCSPYPPLSTSHWPRCHSWWLSVNATSTF